MVLLLDTYIHQEAPLSCETSKKCNCRMAPVCIMRKGGKDDERQKTLCLQKATYFHLTEYLITMRMVFSRFQPKQPLSALLALGIMTSSVFLNTSCTSATEQAEGTKSEKPVSQLADLDAYHIQCSGSTIDLAHPVREISVRLEAQKLEYAPSNLADCSGIFHRVLKNLKERCPSHAYPEVNKYRDSRALARWYQENNTLLLIHDALAQSDLIKPGAVLFYGYGGKKYQHFSAEDLFVRGKGINHVGVVVEVTKNDQDEVESYRLFHGRNPKHTAGITDYHLRKPTRDSYPPLGNGPEQWVAFAPIVRDIVE
jgi:hypothetical protein